MNFSVFCILFFIGHIKSRTLSNFAGLKNCSSWINLIVTSCLRFFFHTPLVLLISGVFVRWWKGVNHFIFFIQCIDLWTKFPYCSPLSWILKIYWGSAIPENKDFSCLYICLFPFISCENALELKKARLTEWNWIVVFVF